MICDHDLYDLSAVLKRIRYDLKNPKNIEILNQITLVLKRYKMEDFGFNQIRNALALIDGLNEEVWAFVKHENVYNHFLIMKHARIYELLIRVCNDLKVTLMEGDYLKADDLVDCIHCLPDIIAENNFSVTKSYWKTYVESYRKKWDKTFLIEEQKLLRNIN